MRNPKPMQSGSKVAGDVSQRKRAQIETEILAAVVRSSSDAIITKDLDGIITSWNPGAERIFGYTGSEAIGQSVTMLIPLERLDEEPGILARIRNGEDVDHYETVRRRKDGKLLDISLNVSPVYDVNGIIIGASKIARDITEHKRLVTAEREADMMHRLVETQESERNRIARDLHDQIGQQVTGLRLKIEHISSIVGEGHPAYGQLNVIRDLIQKMDADVGFLSWEMRPTELGFLGLSDALRSFTNEWSRQYGVEAEFHTIAAAEEPLPVNFETSLYRILQEALTNVLKHAGAKKVNVLFHRSTTGISLIIEDDGKGFYPDVVSRGLAGKGLGIMGMKERTELLDGFFEIESHPGKGTTIVCRVPIKPGRKGSTKL